MDTQSNADQQPSAQALELPFDSSDQHRITRMRGQFDSHIKQIEKRLNVEIHSRGSEFSIYGTEEQQRIAKKVLQQLYDEVANDNEIEPDDVHLALNEAGAQATDTSSNGHDNTADASLIRTKKCTIKPRGGNQKKYVNCIRENDINFGIGPAGTGKTYLAVACAVEALLQERVERILLVRPAVEAGEKLGFLPGDLSQKIDPYLRPLYDALYEMLGFEAVGKLIERHIIEVAPLAYMRGRTLNHAFVILDESQNTTKEQMKMFLTRIGFGSTAVITGDPTQVDLPRGHASGLRHSVDVLKNVAGISFSHFGAKDVVRHPLVQRIVEAYDIAEQHEDKRLSE